VTTVVVVVVLLAFGVGLLLPTMRHTTVASIQVRCANNLKQIGLGFMLYANENRGAYPRTKFAPNDTLIPDVTNTGFDSKDPFSPGTTVPDNCVPSSLFLILRTEDLTSAVFNCPATPAQPDAYGGGVHTPLDRCNFTDLKQNLSYSYANPYPDNTALSAGYRLTSSLNPGFVIAGDLNPGPGALAVTVNSSAAQMRQSNSTNHGSAGQNFLFADGHVQWNDNPFVGLDHDNVYCRGVGGPGAAKEDLINSPKDQNDSVLLPTEAQ
jgi:prepilin-type processing-associated H-X9-DG protein